MTTVSMEVQVNHEQFKKAFQGAPQKLGSEMFTALQGSQVAVIAGAKTSANTLIYDMPIGPSGYIRTGTLRGRIMAGPIQKFMAIVGDYVDYAEYVHEGRGGNRSYGRRPFMELGAEQATKKVEDLFAKAIDNTLADMERKVK
jgi:hypothetical protein